MRLPTIEVRLQRLGLSDREARAYLVCLERGRITPAQVAKITGEKRTTVYHLLHTLMQQDLVIEEKEGGRSYFRAHSPSVWRERLAAQAEQIQELIPVLRSVVGAKPTDATIESFRGRQVITVFERMLKCQEKTVFVFRPLIDIDAIAGRTYHFSKRRLAAGIRMHYLESRDHPHPADYVNEHRDRLREVRQLPPGLAVPVTVMIWDQTVAWIAPTEKFAMLTVSRDFSQFMRMVFRALWEISRKV